MAVSRPVREGGDAARPEHEAGHAAPSHQLGPVQVDADDEVQGGFERVLLPFAAQECAAELVAERGLLPGPDNRLHDIVARRRTGAFADGPVRHQASYHRVVIHVSSGLLSGIARF